MSEKKKRRYNSYHPVTGREPLPEGADLSRITLSDYHGIPSEEEGPKGFVSWKWTVGCADINGPARMINEYLEEQAKVIAMSGVPVLKSELIDGDLVLIASPRLYDRVQEARAKETRR